MRIFSVPRHSPREMVILAFLFFANMSFCQQPVKTADVSCAECHAEIYRKYVTTPMANASGFAIDNLVAGEFTHAVSGVEYRVFRDQDQAWLGFLDTRDGRVSGKRRFDYFLGSGHLGVTYLYRQEGYLLESPVAWYAATSGYDMKPGFGRLKEMPPALAIEAGCLRCHMSGVRRPEPGTINRYAGLAFQQMGVTCESCHGDTRAHVETGGKASVLNPARLDAERRDSICISCHLEGDVSVERVGRSVLDYKPGEPIADYLSYFIFESNDPLSRGVSEVEQFSASHCKKASGDRMSCTSCHDPHGSPSSAERAAFYRGKCLTCHSAPQFVSRHYRETPDCTGCHMPPSLAQNIPHVAWTDHRILRQPVGGSLLRPGSNKEVPLIAVFSPKASERDKAVAMYETVVRGKSHDRDGAIAKLEQVYAAGDRDPGVLEALGVLAGMRGEVSESQMRFRELLALDPLNLTAVSDLGVLLARQGNVQAAAELWQQSFARNEDLIGLARNLSAAQCAIGQDEAARKTIADALRFSPGVRDALSFRCAK